VNEYKSIAKLTKGKNISIISDSAHAIGIKTDNFSEMLWGDISCFSLGRGKLISGGEGGLFTTDNPEIYEKALCITQHSNRVKRELGYHSSYYLDDIGYNYRIHPLAAVLGLADLKNANARLNHRRLIWNSFQKGLFKSFEEGIIEMYRSPSEGSWAAYGIPLVFNGSMKQLNILINESQKQNIPLRVGPVEIPLHLKLSQVKNFYKFAQHWTHKKGACPIAEQHCKCHGLWMMSPLDIDEITADYAFELGTKLKMIVDYIN